MPNPSTRRIDVLSKSLDLIRADTLKMTRAPDNAIKKINALPAPTNALREIIVWPITQEQDKPKIIKKIETALIEDRKIANDAINQITEITIEAKDAITDTEKSVSNQLNQLKKTIETPIRPTPMLVTTMRGTPTTNEPIKQKKLKVINEIKARRLNI